MKRFLSTIAFTMLALFAFAQEEEPNTLRYYLKNDSTVDIRISDLKQIRKIGNIAIKNIYTNPSKGVNGSTDFTIANIDSIVFVYVEQPAISDDNVNRNTNGKGTRHNYWALELPRLTDDSDDLFVQHSTADYGITYSLEWDCSKRAQRWTAYQLHAGNLEKNVGRTGGFTKDPDIPSNYQPGVNDYNYSVTGLSRGHMCPSGDRLCSREQNKQTFYMSNMHPQYQALNGGHWGRLEDKLRNKAMSVDTLYLVKAGTIRDDQVITNVQGTDVLVPAYFYMAILAYEKSTDTYKAVGAWMPHENADRRDVPLSSWLISIDELEAKTGVDFFCNLPDAIEEQVESSFDPGYWGF